MTTIDNKLHQIVSDISFLPSLFRIIVLIPIEFLFTVFRKASGHYKKSSTKIEKEIKEKCLSKTNEKPVAIVTGANCGIGFSICKALYRANYHVILACRNEDKAAKALEEIKKTNGKGFLEIMKLDLCSFESIRSFSTKFLAKNIPLKLLINNAGLTSLEYKPTEDKFEESFQANFLGHFLLVKLLTNKLIESKPSRIVNTSSNASYFPVNFDLSSLLDKSKFNSLSTYAQTKLAQVIFTYKYDAQYRAKGVECYSCHPGAVYTEFLRVVKQKPVLMVLKALMKSCDVGALTSIKLALMEPEDTPKSLYYADEIPARPHKDSFDKSLQDELWETSMKLIGEYKDIE